MHICLFDIDGTLLHTGGAGQAAMEAALEEEFNVARRSADIPYAGRTDCAIAADLLRFHGIEANADVIRRFTEAYLQRLPTFLKERDGLILPGIRELLATLAARDDLLMGLLTGNFAAGARLKLEHYGLAGYFRFGGYGDCHHHRDDVARTALEEVRRTLGDRLNPERLWVIGDTPSDIRCGRAIGARVVAVATGVFPMEQLAREEPDHLFADFSDPQPLLALLV